MGKTLIDPARKNKIYETILISTILVGLLSFLLPAIIQHFKYGFIFYINGPDESYYLNYSIALHSVGVSRFSEYLIVLFQNLGLNGSSINFILDSISLIVISSLTFKIFKHLFPNSNKRDILFSVIIILFLPLSFSYINPIIQKICFHISHNEFLKKFVVYNQSTFPIYLRTPESQMSLVLFVISFWLSLRFKKPIIILMILPFLYFFVSIFIATVFLLYYTTQFFENKLIFKRSFYSITISSFITFITVGIGLFFLYHLFPQKELSVVTNLPVFGVSMFILFLVFIGSKIILNTIGISLINKRFILSTIISVLIIYNTQIISGIIIQPQHFEFEVCLLPGIIISIFLLQVTKIKLQLKMLLKASIFAVCCISIIFTFLNTYHENDLLIKRFSRLLENTSIKTDLKNQPEKVAINDPYLSSCITGLYLNKSKCLISSYDNIFLANDSLYTRYLSFKAYVNKQDSSTKKFMCPLLNELDARYLDRFSGYFPIEVSRRGKITAKYNVPNQIPEKTYKLYLVK